MRLRRGPREKCLSTPCTVPRTLKRKSSLALILSPFNATLHNENLHLPCSTSRISLWLESTKWEKLHWNICFKNQTSAVQLAQLIFKMGLLHLIYSFWAAQQKIFHPSPRTIWKSCWAAVRNSQGHNIVDRFIFSIRNCSHFVLRWW